MEIGIWLPVLGGWLRNVQDEGMPLTFEYIKKVAQFADENGFKKILIPELYLNDIKGQKCDTLEAWTTTAALATITRHIELITAVRPFYHHPAVLAKMATTIHHMSKGRLTLNIVSGWWEDEAKQYGATFLPHEKRYKQTQEFVHVLKGLWNEENFSYEGDFYKLERTNFYPKPTPNPMLLAGGESEQAKQTIADYCDAYVMHGGTVAEIKEKILDMKSRRKNSEREPFKSFGMSAYVICKATEEEAQVELKKITTIKDFEGYSGFEHFTTKSKLEQEISLKDYSVSNRSLRPNLIGTPKQIAKKIAEYKAVGVDFLLLQFSPQLQEMKVFSKQVMPLLK